MYSNIRFVTPLPFVDGWEFDRADCFLVLHTVRGRRCPFLEKIECAPGAKCHGGQQHSCAMLTIGVSCGGQVLSGPAAAATSLLKQSDNGKEAKTTEKLRALFYTQWLHEISNHYASLHHSGLEGAVPLLKKRKLTLGALMSSPLQKGPLVLLVALLGKGIQRLRQSVGWLVLW